MSTPYTQFADLLREVEPPPDGTLSRTLHQDERLKAVLFGFAAGQELSEHTSSTPAVMHFLKGEAAVTLGDDQTKGSRIDNLNNYSAITVWFVYAV